MRASRCICDKFLLKELVSSRWHLSYLLAARSGATRLTIDPCGFREHLGGLARRHDIKVVSLFHSVIHHSVRLVRVVHVVCDRGTFPNVTHHLVRQLVELSLRVAETHLGFRVVQACSGTYGLGATSRAFLSLYVLKLLVAVGAVLL